MTKTLNDRIAEAIVDTGSPDYAVRAGALLTLLSDLAFEGDLEGLSGAYQAYTVLLPGDARRIADAVPAKILNQYLYRNQGRSMGAVHAWQAEDPEWAAAIRAALRAPIQFAAVVEEMARSAKRLER